MKRKLLAAMLLAALLLSMIPSVSAETKTFGEMFPDVNFRSYVRSTVLADNSDPKGNSNIPTTAQMNIIKTWTEINVYDYDIASLEGISYFTGLETLTCNENQLTELDVSNNANLKALYCASNQLTKLDVSHNTKLETLECHYNQLTELDISKNTKLLYLDCGDTDRLLRGLDISNNKKLTHLACLGGQLTELDISNNTALTELACWNVPLKELDISKHTNLTMLSLAHTEITELDVSQNTKLETLICAYGQLTELDVSNNTDLTFLRCNNNFLAELDLTNNTKLYNLYCEDNLLTKLDLSNKPELISLDCYGNQLRELELKDVPLARVWTGYEYYIYYTLGPQVIRDTDVQVKTVDDVYVVNLFKLAPGIDISRVKMNDGGALNTTTGNITYTEKVDTISYSYRTNSEYDDWMEVQWTPVYEEDILEPGDVNQDHALDSADVVLLAKYLLGSVPLTDAQRNAADVNSDGAVTTADAVMLAKKLLQSN